MNGEKLGWLKASAVALLWLAALHFVPDALWRVLPGALLDRLTLPAYSMVCQVLVTATGLAAARAVLLRPREFLAFRSPRPWQLASILLLAPAFFVATSYVALKIAEPYLMAELATEGAGASRRNAGAFGQAVTQAPLAVTLLWGAVLAAVAEETAFRGALFGAIENVVAAAWPARGDEERVTSRSVQAQIAGVVATLGAALAFGAMHADMKGSVGIVRVASTTCLGLACGAARWWSGTVLVSMALHFTYNAVSLGVSRGIFRSESEPLVSVVPNPLLAAAVVGILVTAGFTAARRAYAGRE